MSLLAEVETQALWHGSRVDITQIEADFGVGGTAFCYERRVAGVGTGVRDGVVLLNAGTEPPNTASLAAQLSHGRSFDFATYRVAGPAGIILDYGHQLSADRRIMSMTVARTVQEVLPMGSSYAEFLRKLGRSTRRNIERCRQEASRLGVQFNLVIGEAEPNRHELAELCKVNMPTPLPPRRMASVQKMIACQSVPFHTHLRAADGHMISMGGGFIEGDLALMLYQFNDRACHSISPSLMLRAFSVEHLTQKGIRNLAFVGRCSGLLQHACERVASAEMLVLRNALVPHLKHLACRVVEPRSRIARMTVAQR